MRRQFSEGFTDTMGISSSVPVLFLSIDGEDANDCAEFQANFNIEIEARKWQWKIIQSVCGPKGAEGAAAKARSDKKKKPKMVGLVQKCKALIFQITHPDQVDAINFELELPYKTNLPVLIYCSNPDELSATALESCVLAKLSPALRTTRVKVLGYSDKSISTELRNTGVDWLTATLDLPPIKGEEELPEETLSLVVVGSAHVGKTSLLQRYVNDEFNPQQGPTMGIDKFTVRQHFRLPGRTRDQLFILDIWDTAGEARYRTVTLAFYNSAHGFAVVFDVKQRESFDDVITLWFDNIIQAKNSTPFGVVLVACKCDTPVEEWAISKDEIEAFVQQHELAYIETSAAMPAGRQAINEVFSQLVIQTATALSD